MREEMGNKRDRKSDFWISDFSFPIGNFFVDHETQDATKNPQVAIDKRRIKWWGVGGEIFQLPTSISKADSW